MEIHSKYGISFGWGWMLAHNRNKMDFIPNTSKAKRQVTLQCAEKNVRSDSIWSKSATKYVQNIPTTARTLTQADQFSAGWLSVCVHRYTHLRTYTWPYAARWRIQYELLHAHIQHSQIESSPHKVCTRYRHIVLCVCAVRVWVYGCAWVCAQQTIKHFHDHIRQCFKTEFHVKVMNMTNEMKETIKLEFQQRRPEGAKECCRIIVYTWHTANTHTHTLTESEKNELFQAASHRYLRVCVPVKWCVCAIIDYCSPIIYVFQPI